MLKKIIIEEIKKYMEDRKESEYIDEEVLIHDRGIFVNSIIEKLKSSGIEDRIQEEIYKLFNVRESIPEGNKEEGQTTLFLGTLTIHDMNKLREEILKIIVGDDK